MPLDVREYTPKKRDYLKSRGAYCIYVIGQKPTGPLKIGYAFDLRHRFEQLQSGHWLELYLFYALWCPGKPVAMRAEYEIHQLMLKSSRHIRGEWFDVDVEWAVKTVHWVMHNLYPTVRLTTHEDMIGWLRKKPLDRRDWENVA